MFTLVLDLLSQDEMFRATGQIPSSRPISAEPRQTQMDSAPGEGIAPPSEDTAPPTSSKVRPEQAKPLRRTFSEEVEEERTAGSGTDTLAEGGCEGDGNGVPEIELMEVARGVAEDLSQEDEHVSHEQLFGVVAEGEEGDLVTMEGVSADAKRVWRRREGVWRRICQDWRSHRR